MSIGGSLEVAWLLELEVADEAARAQVKVVLDNLNELLLGLALGGVVRLNVDRKRLGNSNGIRNLDEAAVAESGLDKGLCRPPGCIGCRSVNL